MMKRSFVLAALGALLTASCTIVRMEATGSRPQIRSDGLIDGFAGVGIPETGDILVAHVLEEDIAVGLNVLNWVRVEVGAAGFALGLGPLQLGLGTLFYDPEPIPVMGNRPASDEPVEPPELIEAPTEELVEEPEPAD